MTAVGRQVFVVERGRGGAQLLRALVPDAAHLAIGAGGRHGAAINPWDVPDTRDVGAGKVAYLVRLHALLLGNRARWCATRRLGLGDLERTLLTIAIRDVYARAADGEGVASESLLRAVLCDLARQERRDPQGTPAHASTYARLAGRLRDLCAGGRFGDLLDRPTSERARQAPLVVLDVSDVPDEAAAAVLLSIVEFATARAERAPEGHVGLLADVIDLPSGGDDTALPAAFARDSLLDELHDSYTRRRVRAGEARSIAYLHAISDVAHFLHPPTTLSAKRPAIPP
ncbi:MAG: hypothetical protein Q8O56_05230 [Solirubrobacteraceae bacterium]|nr:hypothetical protein [Solirubrobacteraceae bacterium]